MATVFDNLKAIAQQVRDEKNIGANTATKIGDLIDKVIDEITKQLSTIKSTYMLSSEFFSNATGLFASGSGSPITNNVQSDFTGQIYVDTTNKKVYVAESVGTIEWIILN